MKRRRLLSSTLSLAMALSMVTMPAGAYAEESEVSYPEHFDLRSVDTDGDGVGDTSYVTSVKSQGAFDAGFAHASIAAAETSVLGDELLAEYGWNETNLDFSEKQILWFRGITLSEEMDSEQCGEGMVYLAGNEDLGSMSIEGTPFQAASLFSGFTGPMPEEAGAVDGEEYYPDLAYHGKKKMVDYGRVGADNEWDYKVAPESDPPEGYTPLWYSAEDDWSVDEELLMQSVVYLKDANVLPDWNRETLDGYDAAISAIKDQLSKKHAVAINLYMSVDYPLDEDGEPASTDYISDHWAEYCYNPKEKADHTVTIVGWDDNYPKDYFRHTIEGESDEDAYNISTPSQDGAWLVKNSWGSDEVDFPNRSQDNWGTRQGQDVPGSDYEATGDKSTGYFWLSYYDTSYCNAVSYDFTLVPLEELPILYGHDFMPVDTVNAVTYTKKVSMANVFMTEVDSAVTDVSCQTTVPGTKVHYEVYRLKDDAKNPTDGTLIAKKDATYRYAGFHKESLKKTVYLKVGQRISVVVTEETPEGEYTINVQKAKGEVSYSYEIANGEDVLYAVGKINKGESFFNENGTWEDLVNSKKHFLSDEEMDTMALDNFPIRAYGYRAPGTWEKTAKGWKYQRPTGTYAKNQWQQIEGIWYFFDKDEIMEYDAYRQGWYLTKDGTYDGKAQARWIEDETGWRYRLPNGPYLKKTWKKIDGKWYYFKADGYAAQSEFIGGWWIGKNYIQSDPVRCSWHKAGKRWWYGASGWYAKGATYTIDGVEYTFDQNGYLK